jgi:hypothetical protein
MKFPFNLSHRAVQSCNSSFEYYPSKEFELNNRLSHSFSEDLNITSPFEKKYIEVEISDCSLKTKKGEVIV